MTEKELSPEQARLQDGTWASPEEAIITVRSIYQALNTGIMMSRIDHVLLLRAAVDDLDTFIKEEGIRDVNIDYAMRRVNDTLKSPVFDVAGPDEKWVVEPRVALGVLKSMVVVDHGEDSSELYLQEPFAAVPMLEQAWQEARSTE